MKFQVRFGDEEIELEVERNADGKLQLKKSAAEGQIDAFSDVEIDEIPGGFLVRHGISVHEIFTASLGNKQQVDDGHFHHIVESEDPRQAFQKRRRGGSSGNSIAAPMPGRIVKIPVSVGDEIKEGQSLIIIEAMKMENEMRAKSDVKIAEVLVSEGDNVEANAVLIRFESDE